MRLNKKLCPIHMLNPAMSEGILQLLTNKTKFKH